MPAVMLTTNSNRAAPLIICEDCASATEEPICSLSPGSEECKRKRCSVADLSSTSQIGLAMAMGRYNPVKPKAKRIFFER